MKKVTREVAGVTVSVEDYAYNALGALKVNAGVVLDDQRPRLDGNGTADAAVPATFGGQPVVLDGGGRVTSLKSTTFTYSSTPWILRKVTPPAPALPIRFGQDPDLRRIAEVRGTTQAEFYYYEGQDRIATLAQGNGGVLESYLFDGIDHPLRIKRGSTTAYYELDLAGNVRGLRLSGGNSLGDYRYTAFGKSVEDTTSFVQPLRWKARWRQAFGGIESYDVRARQWSPDLAAFVAIDDYRYQRPSTTLWGWPTQNPLSESDPFGHGPLDVAECLWLGGRFADCWAQEQDRLQNACNDNPQGCRLLGGMPGRGGPNSSDERVIRNACDEEAKIAEDDCLRRNFDSILRSFTCSKAKNVARRRGLEKAGLAYTSFEPDMMCLPFEVPVPVF